MYFIQNMCYLFPTNRVLEMGQPQQLLNNCKTILIWYEVKMEMYGKLNKPAVQAAGADPFR